MGAMALQATRPQIEGLQGEWILEVTISGSPFRFGTISVEVEQDVGADIKFFEGLSPITLGLSSQGSPDFSVPISLDAGESWAAIVASYNTFERAPAVLRRIFEGQTLEETRVVIQGTVEGLAYGEENGEISFNIVRRARTQSRMFPSPGMTVDLTTWPVRVGFQLDPTIIGTSYPIVIGAPGTRPAGAAGSIPRPGNEALLVEEGNPDSRMLIAGHKVAATSVTIFDFTEDGTVPVSIHPILTVEDGVGRTVSMVDMQASGITIEFGRLYFVGWLIEDGGGLPNPKGGGVLRGAGDLIEWVIQTWTDIRIDAARFGGIRERLNAYKIDTYLNVPIDPMAWLNSEIIPLLPIEPRQGEEGLYWYMRRWDATSSDAVARLDADLGQVQRESLVTTESAQVVNEVTVRFGPDRATGRFALMVVVGADDQTRSNDEIESGLVTTDSRMLGGYRAQLSQSIYGRQSLEVEAASVWDIATAALIGQDIIAEQSLPRRFVDYSGGTDLEAFDIGQILILNDSAVQLLDVIVQVLDITVGGPDIILHLELFDDPVLSERLT